LIVGGQAVIAPEKSDWGNSQSDLFDIGHFSART